MITFSDVYLAFRMWGQRMHQKDLSDKQAPKHFMGVDVLLPERQRRDR